MVDEAAPIDKVPRWFEGVELNYAENMLWSRDGAAGDPPGHRGKVGKEDDKIALTEVREGNTEMRHVTYGMLRKLAGLYTSALHTAGVRRGDRIVVVAANSVETLVLLLATTWLGALFSSSSTDMGVQGILQRTVQVNPKVSWRCQALIPAIGLAGANNSSSYSWTTRPSTTGSGWIYGRRWRTS